VNITHDLIAAVTGPGWKYGLSRILINDEGEGVVFIAGSQEPLAFFTVQNTSTSRGAGFNDDGEITWRRRGSSCQYKLAKCKVATETIADWWRMSLQVEQTAEPGEPLPEMGDEYYGPDAKPIPVLEDLL